jgi:hypothetical protein
MIRCVLLILAFAVGTFSPALAANWPVPPPYSAKLIVGTDKKREGRMYRTPNDYRHELRDGKEVVILRLNDNVASVALPGGFALDINFNTGGFALSAMLSGALLDPQAEGPETVNGQATTRYRVALNQPPIATFKGRAWVTKDGIIMRLRGEGAFGGQSGLVDVEARDIVRGPQPENLFSLPPTTSRLKLDALSAARMLQMMSGK